MNPEKSPEAEQIKAYLKEHFNWEPKHYSHTYLEAEAYAVKGLVQQALQDYQSKLQARGPMPSDRMEIEKWVEAGRLAEQQVTGDFSSRHSPRTNKLILDLIYDRKGLTLDGIFNNPIFSPFTIPHLQQIVKDIDDLLALPKHKKNS